jgi:hypothetical protein
MPAIGRDQIILIHGGAYADVKEALTQWVALYAEALGPDYRIELYKHDRGQHLIRVDARVDNERFFYLVNYLYFPEGIHYKVVVEGYTTWRDMEVVVFIPKEERQPDSVYVMTAQKETYKIDFGGKVTKVASLIEFSPPDFDPSLMPPPEIIHPLPEAMHNSPERTQAPPAGPHGSPLRAQPPRRFLLFLPIILALFLLSFLFVGDSTRFLKINGGIGIAVAFWLFLDYKLLQEREHYMMSVALAVVIMIYGFWLAFRFSPPGKPMFFAGGTLAPFIFLALQYPARFTFKVLLKREPVVDRPAPSVADFFYMAVLWMGVLGFFMWVD